jgi:hypothetical protein
MSDYLGNIAAKALDLVPLIRPRPAALFEPAPDVGGATGSRIGGSAQVLHDPPSVRTIAPDPAAQPPLPLQQGGVHSTVSPHQSLTDDPMSYKDTIGRAPPSGNRQPVHTAGMPEMVAALQPLASPANAFRYTAPSTTPDLESETPMEQRGGEPPPGRRSLVVPGDSAPTDEDTEPNAWFAPETLPQATAPSSAHTDRGFHDVFLAETGSPSARRTDRTTGKIVIQPLVKQEGVPPVPTAVDPASAAAPTPIIRVSIGRVEVRAIVSPPPPVSRPRAVRPSTTLSLDEYLKSRQRGQR